MSEEDLEAHHLPEDRKRFRRERKIAARTDRSKYKKSDQDQLERTRVREVKPPRAGLLCGRVLSVQGLQITVQAEDRSYSCVLKGALKKEIRRVKNLIAVGDLVYFEVTSEGEGAIEQIEERYSLLSRADALSRQKQQLIAANIDQVLITGSVVRPLLKPALIDRYIISAHKGKMEPVIVINKIDLLDEPGAEEERTLFHQIVSLYRELGLIVVPVSADQGEGIDQLREVMKGRTSVFSGQSGVGKSSLINTLTGLDLAVREVVAQTRKGTHTTTSAQLIPLDSGGWCIDTPGIRSFGVWDLTQREIERYYTEIAEVGKECKYSDCTHTHEPGCAVLAAVGQRDISHLRYDSYCALLASVQDENHRRR